jgi:hypothetical protein
LLGVLPEVGLHSATVGELVLGYMGRGPPRV